MITFHALILKGCQPLKTFWQDQVTFYDDQVIGHFFNMNKMLSQFFYYKEFSVLRWMQLESRDQGTTEFCWQNSQ